MGEASCRLCRQQWDLGADFCISCGAPGADRSPSTGSTWRNALGLALVAVSAVISTAFLVSDLLQDRHSLSTKDGRFSREVRCREAGSSECLRAP